MSCSTVSTTLEVTKYQVDWEREIESLDKKEMELHQSQMKLIREQMTGFIRDLAGLREVVAQLSSQRAGGDVAALEQQAPPKEKEVMREETGGCNVFGDEIARVERMLKDSSEKQSWDCADVRQQHELLAMQFTKHSKDVEELKEALPTVEDRLAKIEASLAAGAEAPDGQYRWARPSGQEDDLQDEELSSWQQAQELVHARLVACEKHGTMFVELQRAQSSLAGEKAQLDLLCGSLKDRVDGIEEALRESTDQKLEAAQNRLEDMHSRLLVCEKVGPSVLELRRSCAELAESRDAFSVDQSAIRDRLDDFEALFGDAANRQTKEMSALRAVHERQASALAKHASLVDTVAAKLECSDALPERFEYLQQQLGDSVDRHTSEVAELHKRLTVEQGSRERAHGSIRDLLQREQEDRNRLELALNERVGSIESTTDRHTQELAQVTSEQRQLAGEVRRCGERQGSMGDLATQVERSLAEAAEKQTSEMTAMKAVMECYSSRMSIIKEAWTQEGPCSP